ncbi:MAG: hypothetical protein ABID64_03240 [Nitrospirota bacterium]
MGKEPEWKTKAVPVMLQEAETGVITQSTEDALEHERLKAQEKIEGLRKFHREGVISYDQMEVGIKEVRERLRQLLIDSDILI